VIGLTEAHMPLTHNQSRSNALTPEPPASLQTQESIMVRPSRQQGFTLVEIAIVLVIIGLLIGGVLKGQEMITNAKVSKVENDYKGITAAILAYQDRYGVLPGDDPSASTRFPGTWSAADNGNGNGVVAGN